MVNPTLTTLGAKRKSHHRSLEHRSYKVMEVVDPGVSWTHLEYEIKGVGRLSVWGDVA